MKWYLCHCKIIIHQAYFNYSGEVGSDIVIAQNYKGIKLCKFIVLTVVVICKLETRNSGSDVCTHITRETDKMY